MMLQVPMHLVYACFVIFMIALQPGSCSPCSSSGPSWACQSAMR
jgi:hypothetical protein